MSPVCSINQGNYKQISQRFLKQLAPADSPIVNVGILAVTPPNNPIKTCWSLVIHPGPGWESPGESLVFSVADEAPPGDGHKWVTKHTCMDVTGLIGRGMVGILDVDTIDLDRMPLELVLWTMFNVPTTRSLGGPGKSLAAFSAESWVVRALICVLDPLGKHLPWSEATAHGEGRARFEELKHMKKALRWDEMENTREVVPWLDLKPKESSVE